MSIACSPIFNSLWSDIDASETFPGRRPLLAHYTSIGTLERIMSNDEVWLSHPFCMNDTEELKFGMIEGAAAFRTHAGVEKACTTRERFELLLRGFDHYLREFDHEHAFDTYILCLSEHHPEESDGLLSMWRGYGGNGNGAALVFDLAKLAVSEKSPFIISKIFYASSEQRLHWINMKLDEFAQLIASLSIADDQLHYAAQAWLERLKAFAIFTKHQGFQEEREWRIVYWSQRDPRKALGSMFDYSIGPRGLEPKLKFKVQHIEGVTTEDLSLEKIVHKIILGPSVSNILTVKTIERMLKKTGKVALIERLFTSTTPFRSV